MMGAAKHVTTDTARKTGLLEHASKNNFVVVFPQNNDEYGSWAGGLTSDVNHDQITSIKEMMKILRGNGPGRPVKDCRGYGDGED